MATKLKKKVKDKNDKNPFKFRSFTDQIASIRIDVIHRVGTLPADIPTEEQTFFHQALLKWREINCSASFIEFYKDVFEKSQSLPLLVFHKATVIDALKIHFDRKDKLELESLLDLLVQLARDLQDEFYPYFKEFFPLLVSLCQSPDAKLIEEVFTCLAYLFKFLWRHMLRDMTNVFELYSELLMSSQRDYIRQFAVESFAFLLRKVRNVEGLCDLVLGAVAIEPELAEGIGQLMFEVCRGVQNMFHSCTEKFLTVVYSKAYSYDTVENQYKLQSLCKMTELMVEYTQEKELTLPLWNPLLSAVEEVTVLWGGHLPSISSVHLSNLLHLVGIIVSSKNGSRIATSIRNRLLKAVLTLVAHPSVPQVTISQLPIVTLHLVVSLLLTGGCSQSSGCGQEQEQIINSVFNNGWKNRIDYVIEFVQELLIGSLPDFNKRILPLCLRYCEECSTKQDNWSQILLLLTILCTCHPDCSSLDLTQLTTSTVEMSHTINSGRVLRGRKRPLSSIMTDDTKERNNNNNILIMLTTLLKRQMLSGELLKEPSVLWSVLKVLQHIKHVPGIISEMLTTLYHQYTITNTSAVVNTHYIGLCIIGQIVQTLVAISQRRSIKNTQLLSVDSVLNLIVSYPTCLPVLESVLTYCTTVLDDSKRNWCHLERILPSLINNINSSSDEIRSVTLQLLNFFDNDHEEGYCKVFEMCLQAESVPVSLETYRNKIIFLSKLKYFPERYSALPDELKEVPLRYLLGVLYINFNLLWEPVIELISTYACPELKKMFWSVFEKVLQTVNDNKSEATPLQDTPPIEDSLENIFQEFVNKKRKFEIGRPDHSNYRRLLWRCMEKFPKFSEGRSRIFVPLFLKFIDEEYGLNSDMISNGDNINEEQEMEIDKEGDKRDKETTVENGTKEEEYKHVKSTKTKRETPQLNKTLIVMLTLLSKMNPFNVTSHQTLYDIYMKLLLNRDVKIQKLSLACLLTYKQPFLHSYKENLELLFEDSSFQDQLLLLSSSSEHSIVTEEHIEGLIPILIRLLYGQMRGKGTSSRKGPILRYIAACDEREISELVSIMIGPFNSYTSNASDSNNSPIISTVFSLRRQYGLLQEIKQLLAIVTNELEPHLPQLLPLLINIGRSCNTLLTTDKRKELVSSFINSLKNIRQLAYSLFCEIFETFFYIDYSPYKDDILHSLVYPLIIKLPVECLHSPTPLMKLLVVWSQHYELLSFFTATHPILHYVYECLSVDNVSSLVAQTILQLTLNLLKPFENEEEGEEEDGEKMDTFESLTPPGLDLIQPYIPKLLKYISVVIKGKHYNKEGKSQLEFELLSKICVYVTEKSEAEMLIELLLPLLSSNLKKECDKILTSVLNLITFSSVNLFKFYSQLCKLFSSLYKRSSRKLLVNIFAEFSKREIFLLPTSAIVTKVNAWDPNQIEEPDYLVRQEGFLEGVELIKTINLSTKEGLQSVIPIIHNALYFIHETDELSLRDGAVNVVTSLIEVIPQHSMQSFEVLILGTIVPSLKNGLRSKKEATIVEFIGILSQLTQTGSTHFSELLPLTHTDPEVDFFKNVHHIQLHRRTRAYRKLASVCSQYPLSQSTMNSYLLPIASHVVFSLLSSREGNMLLEAVNVIGVIASKLNWNNYYNLLRHYLHQLPRNIDIHRHIIRVVVAILDHFHFTSTNTNNNTDTINALPSNTSTTNEQEMREDTGDNEQDMKGKKEKEKESKGEEKDIEKGGEKDDTSNNNNNNNDISDVIHKAIISHILPSLESVLTLQSEMPQHRLSQKEHNFDAEKLRVPVAMAMTKLLLCLPKISIETHLPSLILKVCHCLRSRAQDVRTIARTTLLKMTQSLGPDYIYLILNELRDALTRGYQLHILSFTIHHLLHGVTSMLKVGDLDSSLCHFNEVLISDLFGHPAEERTVDKLINKISEGKKCKSPHTYGIVVRYLSPSLLPSLLQPLHETLTSQPTSKNVLIVEDVLKKVSTGILNNKGFTPQTLLLFIHGIINSTIPELKPKQKVVPAANEEGASLRPRDSRLLPPKPSRSKPRPVFEGDVSAHVISQFGLQLLDLSLKKDKFKPLSSLEILQMLDPFVILLCESLMSRHVKLLSRSLQVVMRILTLPLPSLKSNLPKIVQELFAILKHYAHLGSACSVANQELVATAFKAMTLIIDDHKTYSVSKDELTLLLAYIEQDVHDYKRQSTAFPLLKAILTRKLQTSEIHDVMWKVAELSIIGDSNKVRANSRRAVLQFVTTYSLGKKVNQYFDFYVANLSYEEQHGRESVLEMLNLFFNKLTQDILNEQGMFFFVPLAAQLLNEESELCRKMITHLMKILITKVNKEVKTSISSIIAENSVLSTLSL